MKIRPLGSELFHACDRADRAEMTKLIVTVSQFWKSAQERGTGKSCFYEAVEEGHKDIWK